MIHFTFNENDLRYLFLKADFTDDEKVDIYNKDTKRYSKRHIFDVICDYVNLTDPICFLPTYSGPPFTQDFVFNYVQASGQRLLYCSIGLWQEIYKILKKYNVKFDGLMENQKYMKPGIKHTFEEFKDIVDSWGLKFSPRPYQYEAAYNILQWKQSTSELATRAGKTLIAYIIFRYEMEYMGMKRILAIVPSIDLVKQMYNDFNEYQEFFKTECVWAGGKMVESANITVGTFQSLIKFLDKTSKKYNPHFFDGYDCVFVDETHRATAKQIKTIISQPFMREVKIAFGMTGTMPKEHTIEHYCLHSLLGAKIQEIKPRELMDAGYISDIAIEQHKLIYTDVEKQKDLFIKCAEYALADFKFQPNKKNPNRKEKILLANPEFLIRYVKILPETIVEARNEIYTNNSETFKDEYITLLKALIKNSTHTNGLVIERMMSHFMKERVDYLCDVILPKCDKNTLVLAHHTEYIKWFAEIVKEKFPGKHIDVITGAINDKRRDKIKQMLKDNNDCILIGSYGVMSTGITLSNLCYGVLFESFKSNVINMQSIGRGLGLSDLKDKYRLYDIIDSFDKCIGNKIASQGLEKCRIYKNNQYLNKLIKANI